MGRAHFEDQNGPGAPSSAPTAPVSPTPETPPPPVTPTPETPEGREENEPAWAKNQRELLTEMNGYLRRMAPAEEAPPQESERELVVELPPLPKAEKPKATKGPQARGFRRGSKS